MDPFTQRMLERARARQEKIDQKLVSSGQTPKRKPLSDNIENLKKDSSPVKSPSKISRDSTLSPKKSIKEPINSTTKSPRRSIQKPGAITSVATPQPQRLRNDVVVTKNEFKSPRSTKDRRGSDVSVEINIMHRNDVQIEVQVEERDAPLDVVYGSGDSHSGVIVEEIKKETPKAIMSSQPAECRSERTGLRQNVKSRLDRLGNLYSESPSLSSPIHRTEAQFSSGTPPPARAPADARRQGRLAALASQINNWEDDLSHHSTQPEAAKKPLKWQPKAAKEALESSTLDVSIHSIKDINHVLHNTRSPKGVNTRTFTKQSSSDSQQLTTSIVAGLERDGYRRTSAGQSRLVFDFTADTPDRARQEPSAATPTPASATPNMAAMVASQPVAKKPSIKKYKAPTPPRKEEDSSDSDKDKENNVVQVQQEEERDANQNHNDTEYKQTKPAVESASEKSSPVVKRLAPKLNGNADRNSVLSKAAMFEAGSPRAKEKDPAEMSLRERKALFEKNKGAAIIPKAPFGLAPSVKTLHGDKDKKPPTPTKPVLTNNSRTNSKDSVAEDNISQSSLGGGIKGKLAALFNKEQTISEASIANKFKQEREKEMEMLQNRFNYKPEAPKPPTNDSDDDDHNDHEKAPLMGGTVSLQAHRKPEIIANVPKVQDHVDNRPEDKDEEKAQPVKRRIAFSFPLVIGPSHSDPLNSSSWSLNQSCPLPDVDDDVDVDDGQDDVVDQTDVDQDLSEGSQDSPVVLSVLEDVKRIKVNNKQANGTVVQQPTSIYPHLSDIETDNSHQEEYSDCGGSSTENIPDKMNKSDNWGDTSFGREVMNVVKKNNTSYKKAVQSDSDESGAAESELDDLLDEALESEGPTPPKQNKQQGSLSSKSFVYQDKQKPQQSQPREFKSPLKGSSTPHTPRVDRGAELVYSVSFYRRMQSQSSTPSTPLRVIRHTSPSRDLPPPDAAPPLAVTTVRQRIKELHEEVAKQQTVISQASQALNLCASTVEFSGSTEQAEGERLLLLATHRRQACLHEVQRLQVEGAGPAGAAGMASLSVRHLSVPLRRDYVRHLNADGAVGHHAVCLIKCRDRVLATTMQLTTPQDLALTFPDEVRMDPLASDFKVTVEIYLLQASKEVLPHDVKYHINKKSNKLLTPKSKVSSLKTPTPRVQSPGGPLTVRSPQFQPHGYCIFALSQANRSTFTLSKVPCGSPLEGSISLEIKVRLRVPAPPPHAAFLTAFDDVSGLGAWHRRYFRLQPPTLAYWKYPDDVNKKMPIGDIDLSTVVSDKAVRCPRDLCARPNTILLESSVPPGLIIPDTGSLVYFKRGDAVVRRHLLAADTPSDRDEWLACLNQALEYVRCSSHEDD